MKKLSLLLLLLCALITPCFADNLSIGDELKKLPPMKQGIMYGIADNEISYLSTIEVLSWKGISLEAGYSTKQKAVAVISYQILKLKDLGVTIPILDLLECNVGIAAGYDRVGIGNGNAKGNNEFIWGPSISLISVKW